MFVSELISIEEVVYDTQHEMNGVLQDTQFEYSTTLKIRNTAAQRLMSINGQLLMKVLYL